MTDINFFEPYILEKEKSSSSNNVILVASCVAVTLAAGSLGYNTYTMAKHNKAIETLTNELNDAAFKEKYIEATAIAKEKDILTTYDSTLRDIYTSMKNRAMVKEELMTSIYGTVPGGVLFKNISINGGKITIAGESSSENAIAELQYNINNLEFIKGSHVPSITSDLEASETFTFTINCEMEEEYYENK
ncbi:PilN domain-containing protein [Clostridium massiliamazoniense]|uniref:PilN domain-containing protein n=2 Tax=Clostridium TaxID=1485 RepID=UPI0006D78F79|nr:PilN domain-containing protein [Clostridium massiliamazoniense]